MSTLHVDIQKRLARFTLRVCLDADEAGLGLLGASGSGKSMTLRCIAGIETPDEGVIRLGGRTLFDSAAGINLPPQRRNVGYVFQRYALFAHMTVEENIAAGLQGISRAERAARVRELAQMFGLSALLSARPGTLSGGEQQRVALARAMAYRPEALLLDEPLSALDSALRMELEPQLFAYLRRYAGAVMYVSHDWAEAYRMCARVAVLGSGRVEQCGDRDELERHPRTRAAAAIVGCENITAARAVDAHRIDLPAWHTSLTCSTPADAHTAAAGIRARDFQAADGPGENVLRVDSAQLSLSPRAATVCFRAATEQVRWEMDRALWARYEQTGLPAHVRIRPEDILVLNR